jgi:spore coat polysaccharide biosynthesis predicted glycosyltransferase SpsG
MIQADLVISACGQTLHELAYLGIPCIGITSGDDQVLNMKNYVKSGYLLQEIYWNDVDIEEKIFHSIDILRDRKKRSEVSMTGRSIIRGDGLENIYKKIFPN